MCTMIIAYGAGTAEMLDCCLTSLDKHDAGMEYELILATDNEIAEKEGDEVGKKHGGIECVCFDVGIAPTGSGRHARILDAAMEMVFTEKFLTFDSDCLVVGNGWLKDLSNALDNGAAVAGAAWPWVPPPATLDKNTMEYKIRRYHNWHNTHVACQMTYTSFVKDNNLKFGGLYDTGFTIPSKATELGLVVAGWMPTCCAKPSGEFDAEINRHVCVVYGDKVYHHGGASRQANGDKVCWDEFNDARDRVLAEKSADWILEPENCYRYKFDREEEVAQFKMQMHYDAMVEYLKTHNSVFGEGWW